MTRTIIHNDDARDHASLETRAASLDTALLLAIHRGSLPLLACVRDEIARRAATGTDPLVAFAPPLDQQTD